MADALGSIPRLGFAADRGEGDDAELLAQLQDLGDEDGGSGGGDEDDLAEIQRALAGLSSSGGEELGLMSALRGMDDEAAALERELAGAASGPVRPGLAERAAQEKRRAVALKREGKIAEAREALRRSKVLQAEADACGNGGDAMAGISGADGPSLLNASQGAKAALDEANAVLRASVNVQSAVESEENVCDPELLDDLRKLFNASDPAAGDEAAPPPEDPKQLEAQVKAAKLKAVALKRAGDLAGAREALRHSKELQATLLQKFGDGGQEEGAGGGTGPGGSAPSASELKRKAVELRRQGDMEGARAALRAAKELQKKEAS